MRTSTLNRPTPVAQTSRPTTDSAADRLERLARWLLNHQEAQRVWATVEANRARYRIGL